MTDKPKLTPERTLDILYSMRDTNAERLSRPDAYTDQHFQHLKRHHENILACIRKVEKQVFGEELPK